MYQCLNANTSLLVSQQNAGYQIYTERVFYSTYGMQPSEYWKVQTLAGCTTDTVPGLRGISETTAFEIIKLNDWDKIINNDKDLKFPTKRSETAFKKGFINWERERDEKLTRLVCDGKGIKVLKNIRNETKIREWFLKLEFKQFLSPSSFTRLLEVIK
jgi:5'-3' exonuclease